MRRLSAFLENFHNDVNIEIYNTEQKLLYNGKIGDVPHRIERRKNLVLGSAQINSDVIAISVR